MKKINSLSWWRRFCDWWAEDSFIEEEVLLAVLPVQSGEGKRKVFCEVSRYEWDCYPSFYPSRTIDCEFLAVYSLIYSTRVTNVCKAHYIQRTKETNLDVIDKKLFPLLPMK